MRTGRSRSLLAFVLGACFSVLATAALARSVDVEDVRLWARPDGTRLVLDLSGPVRHTMSSLRSPDRLILDIPNARLTQSPRSLPGAQGNVKGMRVGSPPAPGTLRLIVDLTRPSASKSFAVAPSGAMGNRLVVDLESASPGAASTSAPTPVVARSAPAIDGRDIVIAIDAGHGGTDPGSIGKSGTYEKNITLAIARKLKERIDREPGMRAILTRDGDYFVELRDRIVRARRKNADMFISVHADAVLDRTVTGSSVYTLSVRGATDESARWLAHRENSSDLMGGVKLDDKDSVLASVLLDLSQGASMTASMDAASRVLQELDRVGVVRRRAVQNAGFLVLKAPDIPSMLIETAFISNPGEEQKLSSPIYRVQLADAIQAGVKTYFMGNPPPGTRFAQWRDRKDDSAVVAQRDPATDVGRELADSAAGTAQ
jgi:N-acetylmuramoyl-L-alanine amidase